MLSGPILGVYNKFPEPYRRKGKCKGQTQAYFLEIWPNRPNRLQTGHINFYFAILMLFWAPWIIKNPKKMIFNNLDIFSYANSMT